jgi:ketosteroid isomerase-like protein
MTEDNNEILAAQTRFDAAELHDDRAALDELIADDFRSIGPKGFVLDKRQWIDRHDKFRYHELRTSEIEVRRYGDAAIVRNLQTNRATHDRDEVRLTVRVSQTWVKLQGRWQIAGIQFSPMAAA